MVKRFIAYVLLVSLITANYSRYFVYAGLELNKKYIAAKLCENLDKPWLHCNGHCYFMKKIKAAEENDKKQTEKNNLSRLEISFFQEPARLNFSGPASAAIQKGSLPKYTYLYSNSYMDTIFRPPKPVA